MVDKEDTRRTTDNGRQTMPGAGAWHKQAPHRLAKNCLMKVG